MYNVLKIVIDKKVALVIAIGVLFLSCAVKYYTAQDIYTTKLIEKLNWNSFTLSTTYASSLVIGKDAKKIKASKGKGKLKSLVSYLTRPDKAVIIHVILTTEIEPSRAVLKQFLHYNKDTIDFVDYSYNGLSWKLRLNGQHEDYEIQPNAIVNIEKYWRSKVK